jgi:hypothetical protein
MVQVCSGLLKWALVFSGPYPATWPAHMPWPAAFQCYEQKLDCEHEAYIANQAFVLDSGRIYRTAACESQSN